MTDVFQDPSTWARDEFGGARLGDKRRTARLVMMAAQAATTPGGTIASVFHDPKDSDAAYDWIEDDTIPLLAVQRARDVATARRARAHPFVFVATDGSSITTTDRARTKETGPGGHTGMKSRGTKVHSALVLDPEGLPLGLCGQWWWTRAERTLRRHHDRRPLAAKETQYWLKARTHVRDLLLAYAPTTRVWFQHDRGADAWPVLLDMVGQPSDESTTVRAAWDRLLVSSEPTSDPATRSLRAALTRTSPVGVPYAVSVRARQGRGARTARMRVRFAKVTLDLRDRLTRQHQPAPVWAVVASEEGTTPPGEEPLAWLLLTTYPVECFEDACLVVFGYTLRWRIEEFHAAWKSCCGDMEASQLTTRDRRAKWGTILSSVAVRVVRLKLLARAKPELPATTEFTPDELAALRALHAHRPLAASLTLVEAVRHTAQIGGYTGSSSGGPPGTLTIARGLERIRIVAEALREGGEQLLEYLQQRSISLDTGTKRGMPK